MLKYDPHKVKSWIRHWHWHYVNFENNIAFAAQMDQLT